MQALQSLVNICNSELSFLDMSKSINPKKSACMRFGPKYRNVCANVVASRSVINWMTSCRYLGVYLESSVKFKCSFGKNKASFYQAFNNIFGKIGRNASEEVLFSLIKSKCLPVLLYGTEVCSMNSADRQSLQFTVNKILFKIFGAMSKDTYSEVSKYFGIEPLEEVIGVRRDKFLKRYCATDSYLCRLINARH